MKRKGNSLLLDCGHVVLLGETITTSCFECDTEHCDNDDPFIDGFRAGLSARYGVQYKDLQEIGTAWLTAATERMGHSAGCLCHACCIARKLQRLVLINTLLPGDDQ